MFNLPLRLLADGKESTLRQICGDKLVVIDFWHSNCSRCPTVLEKLNREVSKHPDTVFVACALSQGAGNFELTQEMIEDTWENLTHVFFDLDQKEQIKTELGLKSVPFYAVANQQGEIVAKGEPKNVNWEDELNKLRSVAAAGGAGGAGGAGATSAGAGALVLDEDF